MNHEISKACNQTDAILWNAYARSNQGACSTHLFFPQYRSKGLRVSEQERRFAFVEALSKSSLLYSVEAPTSKTYRFSGDSEKKQSAQTDLAVYNLKGEDICRVEFKSQGYSLNRKILPIFTRTYRSYCASQSGGYGFIFCVVYTILPSISFLM